MSENDKELFDSTELRRQAEAKLGESCDTPPFGADYELTKLYHELQVHQVELEMQNAELWQTQRDLETSLNQFTDLYDFSPVGYFTFNHKGTITRANLTGANILGVERSRLVGGNFRQFVTDDTRADFTAFLEKVFSSSDKVVNEIALVRKGTAPLFVLVEGITVASGQECHVALIDITERKRTEELLRIANVTANTIRIEKEANHSLHLSQELDEAHRLSQEAINSLNRMQKSAKMLSLDKEAAEMARLAQESIEAFHLAQEKAEELRLVQKLAEKFRIAKESTEEKARFKNQFLINMSHELRTPMTGLLGMLQFALEEDQSPELRGYLETALKSARSLLRILNDILDMAKLEVGTLLMEEQPFSPQECITEAVNIITSEVRRKGLDLSVSVSEDVPNMVIGDQMRLRQVLINLIGNAVKFTNEGSVKVRVIAGEHTSDGKRELKFVVTDTGIGIPADKKELLFHSFSQVDPSMSRNFGGTGLGLAISREIVELMGGTISVESKQGEGSSFSFTIPLDETVCEREVLLETESHSPEAETSILNEEKITRLLLAEDEPVIQEVLGLMLKRSGYILDFAEDGLKAIEMWEHGEYDLILMDVQMPRLNGFEATGIIRKKEQEQGRHTPIIAMTAHASKEDEDECFAAGMDAYISKPIDFQKSLQVISDTIKKTAAH